jgi:mono/diheme cytochrome c family protein
MRTGLAVILAVAGSFSGPLFAQTSKADSKTVLDGVYTEQQATLGGSAYATYCASCHRADLGGFSAPPLVGDIFMDRWREFNLDVLYDLIVTTMPASAVGSLKQDQYLQILAFLLQSNGIPAGDKELTTAAVRTTLLVGKNGPQPLPNSSSVAALGCFTLDSGNGFFLTKATEPVRTLNAYEISAEELRDAKDQPLGNLLFRLQNAGDLPDFNPEPLVGNKMEAKGILVRQANNPRINVLALKMVSPGCE